MEGAAGSSGENERWECTVAGKGWSAVTAKQVEGAGLMLQKLEPRRPGEKPFYRKSS